MLAGAVLCGGASRRMGRDKALIEVDGKPMAQRVLMAQREAGCDPVVFVGGDSVALGGLGGAYVADLAAGEGPLGGIVTALRHFRAAELVVINSCDVAYLTAAALRALIDRAGSCDADHADVIVARTDRIEPLCAVWRVQVLPAVEQLFDGGERALHRVVDQLSAVTVAVDPGALRKLNTPGDLAQ